MIFAVVESPKPPVNLAGVHANIMHYSGPKLSAKKQFPNTLHCGKQSYLLVCEAFDKPKWRWVFPLPNPKRTNHHCRPTKNTDLLAALFFFDSNSTRPTRLTPHWRSSEQHRWTISGMADLRLSDTLIANGANGANVRELTSTSWAEMEDKDL